MKNKKKILALGFGVLLSSNVMAKTDDVDIDLSKIGSLGLRFCSSCKLKLPEELKFKDYPYFVGNDFIFDEAGKFIGLVEVDRALKNAGISNYKIDIMPDNGGGELYFDVKTNDANKNYLSLILTRIDGVSNGGNPGDEEVTTEKIKNTDGYASCYKRAYGNALQKLKAYFDDTKYDYDYNESEEGDYIKFIDEDTFEINVCLEANGVEKKEEEEE